jgi:ribosome-associated protein
VEVPIRTDWIRLDQLLKLAGAVQVGGEAKLRVQAGEVTVNGEVETRRGRKLRPGDVVETGGERLVVSKREG